MCGIAGFYNISRPSFFVDTELLERMQKSIEHRGPDGYRIWSSQEHQLGIAHRRLSIMDLSQEAFQPMFDEEKTVMVCCNGEIYNHPHLRRELEQRGYRYRTNSDTETIVYAYKEWGIGAIEKLEGMFAIVIYDLSRRELYLVRDRMGVKPLYFSLQEDVLSFASEIKALWCLPWITRQIRDEGVSHYLTYLATPAPMTLYRGIYKMPAGMYLKVDSAREVSFHEWYTPLRPSQRYTHEQVACEQFCVDQIRYLLRNSVQQQMMSDVPVGAFLSGGVDSSLNVALMSEYSTNVHTFTVACADGPEYNELAWARQVAQQFNTQHHEIIITERDAFNFFERMVYHQDEPLGDCVCIPLYYVAKLLKDSGVTVVQVGEGSDELFCGYSLYAQYLNLESSWHRSQRYMPAYARKACYAIASRMFPAKYNKLDCMRNWAYDRALFWSGAVVFSEQWKREFLIAQHEVTDPIIELMYPGFAQTMDSYSVVDYHRQRLLQLDPGADELTIMTYLELKHRLPELLLMRVDKMSMAVSVEGRVPFLDHHLVEFALQITRSLKYKDGQTKYILKKACEGIVPNDIIYRKKIGFAAPTTRWFKQGSHFPNLLRDLLHDKGNDLTEYIDVPFIEQMLNDTASTSVDYSYQLWAVQNLLASGVSR